MIKVLSAAALMALTPTTTFAADMALKAPVTPVKFTWTGCFVGGHIGAVVSQDRTTNLAGRSIDFGSSEFVGGGQIGCNYQFATNWVIGGEGRAAWSNLANTHAGSVRNIATGIVVPSQVTLRNDFLASATARLGYVYAERWMVYARGGAAWTREKMDDAYIAPLPGIAVDPSATTTRTGWTAGGGVEWAFAPHWSANVEYNYYDFGAKALLLTGPFTTVSVASLKDTIHAATVGLNYHF